MIERIETIEAHIRKDGGEFSWESTTGELIRCKDCRHYNGDHKYCYYDVWSVENGYCWMAERKDESQEGTCSGN